MKETEIFITRGEEKMMGLRRMQAAMRVMTRDEDERGRHLLRGGVGRWRREEDN